MKKRREILEQEMTIVPNRVHLSEKHEVKVSFQHLTCTFDRTVSVV